MDKSVYVFRNFRERSKRQDPYDLDLYNVADF